MLPNFLLTRVYGVENLAKAECASIYVFNHNNSFEVLMVPALLMYHLGGRSISFVIDWMYGKVPILGFLMNLFDPVYVYHKRSTLSSIESIRPTAPSADAIERCTEKLRAGRSIGIFPEGKRNRDSKTLLRGKSGVGHIALQSGSPVVPVGIDFNCRITKGKIPVLGRTIVRIGQPIVFQQRTERYRAMISSLSGCSTQRSELNQMAAEVTHEIMHCIAELSGKLYQEPFPRNRRSFS
ncbi:MAG: 1-acyl-sn-glycerol-3-phosphate acyltransferase [Pelodictyon phaeoclathratiforme]|jgi:1-acyl-sn-glycerol-3-phosphate acyltransferase|uniref:Phospholipid/glycerol acyltransferase n=2 Tax=Pelodictyon phaeoclathratiforme TaxID=34090 RepID=B4SAX8_PELPB|nr:phospholipid/glycerol acyltransferase [Pelodictyon phaeoclathratiforme BU-1]MBV5288397.1 1-acyl-sn-glycerol-3-phosphate acyltransferase [Pelodictyon phaeoclathratiforme]